MQWLLMRQLHLAGLAHLPATELSIAHIHGSSINRYRAVGLFNYYWMDDHINAAADIGANCGDVEQSLRQAVISVLGHGAINEDKFTPWRTQQQVLGLVFDSTAKTVAMPEAKIRKAVVCVRAALQADALSRADYQSLLGRLRHVATCVRPARPFLQRLRQQERHRHRWQRIPVSEEMKQDLLWWVIILNSPLLNGVPLQYFRAHPSPDVIVEMDASNSGICVLVPADRAVLRYAFTDSEQTLIKATKADPRLGFDINYRELLSCAFAVDALGRKSSTARSRADNGPLHVQFRIDNTSAVSWQNKMSSRNVRAQTIIRLLGYWELEYGLRFSAVHVVGADNQIADAGSRTNSSRTMATLFDGRTSVWMQVNPSTDVSSLEATWRIISVPTLSRYPHTPSTATS